MDPVDKVREELFRERLFQLAMGLAIFGVGFLFTYLTRDPVASVDDLRTISGHVRGYSFEHGPRGTRRYYLTIVEYPAVFQIRADNVRDFDRTLFEQTVRAGDVVTLGISAHRAKAGLQAGERVPVYAVMKGDVAYLKAERAVRNLNDSLLPLAGITALLAAASIMVVRMCRDPSVDSADRDAGTPD